MKVRKLLGLLLAAVMVFAMIAACATAEDTADVTVDPTPAPEGEVEATPEPEDELPELGARDELIARAAALPAPTGHLVARASVGPDANIWTAAWTNAASNAQAREAMGGLTTMARNSANLVFPCPIVMVDGAMPEITDNADGSRTYTFTIYTDNQFSDGSFVDASHYAGGIAFFVSHQWGTLRPISATPHVVGRNAFAGQAEDENGDPIAGESVEPAETLTGVRILADNQFSVTIRPEGLPHVWETFDYMMWEPMPLHALGIEAHDDGDGVFLTAIGGGELTAEAVNLAVNGGDLQNIYATDEDGEYELDEDGERIVVGEIGGGFRFNPTVVAGPYMFDSVDVGGGTITLRANPYFRTTWDGYRPRIEQFILRYVPTDLTMDAMAAGEIAITANVTVGDIIAEGFSTLIDVSDPQHFHNQFPGLTLWLVQFQVDHGPTQSRNVRAAIAYMLDRHLAVELFGRGFASIAHSQYLPAWWWYHAAVERGLDDLLIQYDLNMEEAIRLLEEDGWIYNANGDPFEGPGAEGNYRHRMIDGELEELHIMWVTPPADRPFRDSIDFQLEENMLYAGMRMTQDRAIPWDYLQGDDQIYHMFDVGTGFPVLWMPWWLIDPASGPSVNWSNQDWPELLEIANRMRVAEVVTEQGQYEFVSAFMDFVVMQNYMLDRIPVAIVDGFDFVADWVGNWEGTAFWSIGQAITRAYDTRN